MAAGHPEAFLKLSMSAEPSTNPVDVELARIRALAVQIPYLSSTELVLQSFERFNSGLADGEARAEEIVKDFSPDQEDKRRAWIEDQCLTLLRSRIALLNAELAQLAKETKSPAVKAAVTAKVQELIAAKYPSLAEAVARDRARKSSAAAAAASPAPAAEGVEVDFDIPAEATPSSLEAEVRRAADLALLCLREMTEYVVPMAAKQNIAMDAATIHAWAMHLFLMMRKRK